MTDGNCEDSHDDLLNSLIEEFLYKRRCGKYASVGEFANQHPEVAEEIRDMLPAILLAEQLNSSANTNLAHRPEDRPAQLGPFVLEREIGRGGMGIVYEASQAPFTQKFAVKILQHRFAQSTALKTRFEREAQAASRLHHPNIVPARHYGTEDHLSFLVMPMIDGVSVDRLIQGAECAPELSGLFFDICRDWRRFAQIGAQIASALSHAHHSGMIHRDIKPANLILDREGNVWVTDFGLAKLYDDEGELSRTGELIGTPRYMAPEQLGGIADERSDIYGVGITLYEMLALECPWGSIASSDSARGPAFELPDLRDLNPQVPVSLSKTIMKACAHRPEDRYRSARELEVAFNEICYSGRSDRRNSQRSRATVSLNQARSVAVVLGVVAILSISLSQYMRRPIQLSLPSLPPHDQYISPRTHCISYKSPDGELTNVIAAVNSRADDVEQYGEGVMYLDSTDLELTWDETDQVIGLRFVGVEIPPGAKIVSAKLCFYAERTDRGETHLRVYGVDDPDPPQFTPLPYDLTNRTRTTLFVDWMPGKWKRSEQYETPDLTELVQSLVNNQEWGFGNAMAFVIDGTGNRTATAFDGNIHYGPTLRVQYQQGNAKDID